jgi:hypothetical protein
MKDEPTDETSNPSGKNELTGDDYRYFEHYYHGGGRASR